MFSKRKFIKFVPKLIFVSLFFGMASTTKINAVGDFHKPDALDAAHISADAARLAGNFLVHKHFISAHKKFILNQMCKEHKMWLKFFKKELSDDIGPKSIKAHIEKHHTLIKLIPSNMSSDNWKAFATFLPESIAKEVVYDVAINKIPSHPEGFTFHWGLRGTSRFFNYLSHVYYGLKTEGREFISRNVLALLASGGVCALFAWTALCYDVNIEVIGTNTVYFFENILRPALEIKNFSNYCRGIWTEYVVQNHKKIQPLMQNYADSFENGSAEELSQARKGLKAFIAKPHDEIPAFRQIVQ